MQPFIRTLLVWAGVSSVSGWFYWQLVKPSEVAMQKHQRKADDNFGHEDSLGLVIQLSAQGHSYNEITKMFAKQKRAKYRQYIKEMEQTRLEEEQAQALAKRKKSILGVAESTARSIADIIHQP